jgi:hypothetical protein
MILITKFCTLFYMHMSLHLTIFVQAWDEILKHYFSILVQISNSSGALQEQKSVHPSKWTHE